METTFYDDSRFSTTKETIKNMKRNLTLDFNSSRPSKKQKVSTLLSSPDLNMLKLASPELEKLIIQQNGVVTTTPTPTQFIFPRDVTVEQEQYARGFVDALAELHGSDSGLSDIQPVTTSATGISTYNNGLPTTTQSSSMPGLTSIPTTTSFPHNSSAFFPVAIKEEPQTVPNLGATPPMSPINMESQERIKLERKRQRNRIAASKCRKRKLERIARLEDKVRILKGENSELGNVVNKLREQVCQLKQQVMDHVHSGCQIMLSPQFWTWCDAHLHRGFYRLRHATMARLSERPRAVAQVSWKWLRPKAAHNFLPRTSFEREKQTVVRMQLPSRLLNKNCFLEATNANYAVTCHKPSNTDNQPHHDDFCYV